MVPFKHTSILLSTVPIFFFLLASISPSSRLRFAVFSLQSGGLASSRTAPRFGDDLDLGDDLIFREFCDPDFDVFCGLGGSPFLDGFFSGTLGSVGVSFKVTIVSWKKNIVIVKMLRYRYFHKFKFHFEYGSTMVHGQAFLIITWQPPFERAPLFTTSGCSEQLCGFEPWKSSSVANIYITIFLSYIYHEENPTIILAQRTNSSV